MLKKLLLILGLFILTTQNITQAMYKNTSYYKLLGFNVDRSNIDPKTLYNAYQAALNSQSDAYVRQEIQAAYEVLANKKSSYDNFLELYAPPARSGAELQTPIRSIFWSSIQSPNKTQDYVLMHAVYDPQTGTTNILTINPDYPWIQLPPNYAFLFSQLGSNPEIGKNKGYEVTDTRTGQRIRLSLNPQTGRFDIPGLSQQTQPPIASSPSPLDDSKLFQPLTPNSQEGWLTILVGGDITTQNAVLARRIGNRRIEFVTRDPNNPALFIPLPKGVWHWQNPDHPQFGYVRITPKAAAFTYDPTTGRWSHSVTKKPLRGKHVFPNQTTANMFQ